MVLRRHAPALNTTNVDWHSSEINSDGGGKSGEGRGGVKLRERGQTPMVAGEGRGRVKLREGSQTPMVVGESGGNLPRAAGDETL